MDKFSKLIVLTEQEHPHSLTLLAQSVGIEVEQKNRVALLYSNLNKPGVLIAFPFSGTDWSKRGQSAELVYLLQQSAVFLYQAERMLVSPMQAVHSGLRGVIYRDEQLDRVLTALKTMISGELYYARSVMSALVDELLQHKKTQCKQAIQLPAQCGLTKQEARIVELVAEGARNKEIAAELEISAHTVKAHMSSIFRKTQARNRVELLRWVQHSASLDTTLVTPS